MRTLYSKFDGNDDICKDIRLHLESLLNSKSYYQHNSILAYGTPDFSQMITDSHYTRNELADQITQSIRNFEPRLKNLFIEIHPTEKKEALALNITAKIWNKNVMLDVRFSSNLQHGLEKLSLNGNYDEPEPIELLSV